jgi:hypothetical protein
MYDAVGVRVGVPFDPYIGLVNFLISSNMFPHITMVIQLLVYHCADEAVTPHQGHTVADFTHQIYDWRNRMSRCGAKDRGQGPGPAVGRRDTISNILGASEDSLGFPRTPTERREDEES